MKRLHEAQVEVLDGKRNFDEHDYEKAIINFRKAITLSPNWSEPWCYIGLIKMQNEDYRAAIDDFTKAIELDSSFSEAWCNRGICKNKVGHLDSAIADIEKAIDLESVRAEYHYSLGVALADARQSERAVAAYTNAIKRKRNYGDAYFNRGLLRGRLGDHDGGCADLKKAESLGYAQATEILKLLGE